MSATRAAPLLPGPEESGSTASRPGRARAAAAERLFGASDNPPARGPNDPADRFGLFDALSPLVTDVRVDDDDRVEEHADPFQALIADIAIQRSREPSARQRDGHRRALLRAIAEMAETHAVAADLACDETEIDLPLDVPDPPPGPARHPTDPAMPGRAALPMLIVPDVIRTCRDRLAVHASAVDRNRIDVVATLFDHVLSDDRLATDVRNTLARLQLPVLRMALADDSFFESRTHPTRRLLDRLVASAADQDGDTVGGRTTRAALERVVHTVIRGSFEDAGEHARLLDQFERAIVDSATAASALPVAPVADAEDRDVLVIKATIQISQLLAGVDVDRAIRFFLLDVWSRVLVEIACRQADTGRDALLARAKRLCFDLAWTTAPKTTSGERARLAGLLPTMIAAIRDGLRLIDFPEADERRFFADWTRVLVQAVRSGPGPHFSAVAAGGAEPSIDAFSRHLRHGSFGADTTPAIRDGQGAVPSEVGLRTADDTTPSMLRPGGVDAATGTRSQAPIVIGDLKKGEWFELRERGGFTRVRLSWVSPLRSFYLFIGAESALTRSLDPAALQALVDDGDLRRVPP